MLVSRGEGMETTLTEEQIDTILEQHKKVLMSLAQNTKELVDNMEIKTIKEMMFNRKAFRALMVNAQWNYDIAITISPVKKIEEQKS
jgi:hypothetical protein